MEITCIPTPWKVRVFVMCQAKLGFSILHVHEVHVPHLILNSAHFSTITEFWRGLSLCDGVSF